MNSKKVNRIFLAVVLLHVAVILLLTVFGSVFTLEIIPNLILGQLIILLPSIPGVLLAKENLIKLAGFHKIKISSAFMIILFTFLIMPLTVVINAVSMFFVDNTVAAMSGEILELPFIVMLLIMGIAGPFSEELVFRGIVYQGYKKSGTVLQAMLLSALLFALMHMNFNQAAYAFVIGAIMVLMVEATGSIWSSILIHVVFNSQQVCMMYLSDSSFLGMNEMADVQAQITNEMLMLVISVYLIIAAVTTTLAGCVLVWIAKNEKREENLRAVWTTRKHKKEGKVVTIPLLIAIVITLFYMCLEVILINLH